MGRRGSPAVDTRGVSSAPLNRVSSTRSSSPSELSIEEATDGGDVGDVVDIGVAADEEGGKGETGGGAMEGLVEENLTVRFLPR